MRASDHASWGAGARRPAGSRDKHRQNAFVWYAALLLMVWQSQASAGPVIANVSVSSEGGDVAISVVSSDRAPMQVESFALDDPRRLVFDLPNAAITAEQLASLPTQAPGVRQVRVGQFQADPPTARVVVDLEGDGQTPEWALEEGRSDGETVIVVRTGGPRPLRLPQVSSSGGVSLVRFPGVGALPRRVGQLTDPPRVYLDLTDARVEQGAASHFAEGLVAEVRIGEQPPQSGRPVGRLVVELREEAAFSVFAENGDLVVAIGDEPWTLPLSEYRGAGRLKGRVLVVDPGHGGGKVGAVGALGAGAEAVVFEKDITLDIGERLARLLRAEGAEVVMTRTDDSDVGLQARADLANRLNADVFISIHCNSCDPPVTAQGTSVYYHYPHSAPLANMVQEELVAALGTKDRGVHNANYVVTRVTQGLGILVETAFINNDEDRRRLLQPNFRERAARAVAAGVIRFLSEPRNPEVER